MAAGQPTQDALSWIRANKGLPQQVQPQAPTPQYGDLNGIAYNHQGLPSDIGASELGIARTLTNPTPGTAVAYALQTSFVNTSAMYAWYNASKVGARFSLRRLKLMLTLAPTATVSMEFATRIDDGAILALGPTAGSVNTPMLNPNLDDKTQSDITCFSFSAGVMTVPAPSARSRIVGRGRIPTGLGIVGDEYNVMFGGGESTGKSPLAVVRATDPGQFSTQMNAATIGPGQWLFLYMWWLTAATSAPQFEWETSGYEKP